MSEFFNWLMQFVREFKFLFIVLPWERAVRTRLGNRVILWEPGCHIRLPFVDDVQLQNTRLRLSGAGPNTISTSDGKVLTLAMAIGFSITDPLAAVLRMHHPEISVASLASSVAAEIVARTAMADLLPSAIEAHVMAELSKEPGYTFEFVRVTDFAFARAFRLLSESPFRQVHIEERTQ